MTARVTTRGTERIAPQDTHVELLVMREWVLFVRSQMGIGEASARHTSIQTVSFLASL
jgi:hypothetical protein